jgi:poly(3-hydroxybutyrate) depolymerase
MTLTPSWSRSKATTAAMPTTTATATAGMARQNRLRTRMTTIPVSPTARAARFTRPSATPWTKSLISVSSPRPSIENPHSLGSWPTRMVTAMPHR